MIVIKFILILLIAITIVTIIKNIFVEKLNKKKKKSKLKNILLIISIGTFVIALVCVNNYIALIMFFIMLFGIIKTLKKKK